MRRCSVVLVFVVTCLAPVVAFAQATAAAPSPDPTKSHWGLSGSFTPTWKVPEALGDMFDGTVDISGSEFTIGLVRGRSTSGDWGISFVRKPFKDGSTVSKPDEDCFDSTCFDRSTRVVTKGVVLTGAELHKFIPFGTIKGRVQIGLNLSAGVATFKGSIEETEHDYDTTFTPGNPNPVRTPTTTVTTKDAKELVDSLSVVPLAHLGVVVAVIAGPNVKLRWEGGLSLPGYSYARLMATILLGKN